MTIEEQGWGIGVDWVTLVVPDNTLSSSTIDNETKNKHAQGIIKHLFRLTGIIIEGVGNPHWGYKYCVTLTGKGQALWSGHSESMGMCVVMPGALLDILRSSGKGYLGRVISELALMKVKVSRVDIAIDFTNMYDITEFAIDAHKGYGNKQRKVRVWETVQGGKGITYYVGSRNSDRFVRTYDKAAQMGIEGVLWVRFEIECKRAIAKQYFYAIADGDADVVINDIAKRYPIENIPVWESVRATPAKLLTPTAKRDTELWVRNIIRAIARGVILWGVKDFVEALNCNLEEQGCAERVGILPVD